MANLPINLIKTLYYKERLSTIEIGKKLHVTPWVVLKFMKRMNLSRRTFKEANAIVFAKKPLSFSVKTNLSIREEQLKIAAIMLYWAEGAKPWGNKACMLDFVNSNSKMVEVFLKFMREICRVSEERFRVQLYCYANQDIENLKKFWYKITSIPLNQFIKPYVRKDFQIEKIGRMEHGLVHVRYCDKKLLKKIGEWINEYCSKIGVDGGVVKRTAL